VALEADATPLLIMDLGTGLRALGEVLDRQLHRQGKPLEATALLTHLHFDHIMGLPFFRPLQDPGAIIDVYGPSQENMTLQEVMKSVVQPPFFPIEMSEFRGELRFLDPADDALVVGNAKIRSRTVPHRGHTLGFRIEADSKTVVYLPDHQAPLDRQEVSDAVLELCEGADVLIHDAQYTDEEFTEKHDWGHSTVPYAIRVAADAGVRRLVLFHHDPAHSDRDIDRMVSTARKLPDARRLADITAAYEGMTIELGS
jgi:ribonuclease BN (tRNA processing enzyme)